MPVTINLTQHIDAPTSVVWSHLADIASHTEWMSDAREIRFTGSKREGVGTSFECVTQIWKFKVTDEMMVSEWVERARLRVYHKGVIEGTGTFAIHHSQVERGTDLEWEEVLTFPWYVGGPLGELIAKPIFTRIWTENLASLKSRAEGPKNVDPLAYFKERGIELIATRKGRTWHVRLFAPAAADFDIQNYSSGPTKYAAHLSALARWYREEEPPEGH